jgi:hypothetical protein
MRLVSVALPDLGAVGRLFSDGRFGGIVVCGLFDRIFVWTHSSLVLCYFVFAIQNKAGSHFQL